MTSLIVLCADCNADLVAQQALAQCPACQRSLCADCLVRHTQTECDTQPIKGFVYDGPAYSDR